MDQPSRVAQLSRCAVRGSFSKATPDVAAGVLCVCQTSMSFNQRMHPRNIFRQKPDFVQLSEQCPELKPHIVRFKNGKGSINFKNPDSMRYLTRCLLQKFFQLKVALPDNRLVPAVPQRLNYVLWVEDLLGTSRSSPCRGIDLGCGACCIFPLLACRNNCSWTFVATEKDAVNLKYAADNVDNNGLSDRISVVPAKADSLLLDLCGSADGDFEFLMCNPPFFATSGEITSLEEIRDRDVARKVMSAGTADEAERVTEGGEVQFVAKLLEESKALTTKIKLYTVMLGRKSSAVCLLKEIKRQYRDSIKSYASTEFYQGNTVRWGLAWTYRHDVGLDGNLLLKEKKIKTYSFCISNKSSDMDQTLNCIKSVLIEELQLEVDTVQCNGTSVELLLKSKVNTWSHQRRKRRKRDNDLATEKSPLTTRQKCVESDVYLLNCTLRLEKQQYGCLLSLTTNEDGEMSPSCKEATHQLFQWLENKCAHGL